MLYFGLIIVTGYVGFFTMAGCCSAALVMRWGWEAFGIGIGVAFAFCACTSPVSIASGGVCLVASASPPACTPATRPATRPAAHRVRARRTAVARRWAHVCCSPYTCIRMHTHGTGLTSAALRVTPRAACSRCPQAAVVISLVQKHFESKRRILATSARDQDIPAPSPPPTVLTDAQAAVARALALAPSAASDAPSEMPSEIPSEIPAVPETTPPAVHT